MPLYEYECEKCGARFEVIQRFSDSPIEACRVCAGPVHKLLSSPAIQFKGTGWYVTDYAKKNGNGHSSSSSHAHASDTKAETKSDSSSSASSSSSSSSGSSSSGASKKE